jgi:hypothetical protein
MFETCAPFMEFEHLGAFSPDTSLYIGHTAYSASQWTRAPNSEQKRIIQVVCYLVIEWDEVHIWLVMNGLSK